MEKRSHHHNYVMNPKSLGEHIRNKRLEDGLTQTDLSKIIGVHYITISEWEMNVNQPRLKYYKKIISFLGYIPTNINDRAKIE